MAIIKCKMCGGDLNVTEGVSVAECEYCGSRQTIPSADNEKKMTLFTRAARLLRGCEFDKASGLFESIVADFPDEAEAYWGLVLCKYGIEYVDDPATGKKVPTCHRSSFESVLDDPNFEQACENADPIARRLYRDEAKQIEELRKSIVEVSSREEPYDIFISYKETASDGDRTLDSVIAQDIYDALTAKGYRVFFSRISLEDKLGIEYEPYIFAALNSAKLMLVVGTDYEYFNAVWVKNEWSRFLKLMAQDKSRHLIPCFKNIDAYDMPKEFNKLSAQDMGKIGAMQDLLHGIEKIIHRKAEEKKETVIVRETASGGPNATALLKRGEMALQDGKWEDAKGYYDRVLDMDAECAEAYLGLYLVEERCPSADALAEKKKRALQSCSAEKKPAQAPDKKRTAEAVKAYAVKNYLTEETVSSLFGFDLNYDCFIPGREQKLHEIKQQLNGSRNLSRAEKFASGDVAKTVADIKSGIIAEAQRLLEKAKADSAAKAEEKRAAYAQHLDEAEKKAKAYHERAVKERESDYIRACALLDEANTEQEFLSVEKRFDPLTGYRDADEKAELCAKKAKEAKEKDCIAKEKADREQRRKNKKAAIIISVLTVLAIAAYFVVITFVVPPRKYKQAEELLAQGSYVEAAALFEALGDYEDSAAKLLEANELEAQRLEMEAKEADYNTAMAEYKDGDYYSAWTQFGKLGDFRDAAEMVLASRYAYAQSLLAYGRDADYANIALAREIFLQLGDYKDSKLYVSQMMEVLINIRKVDEGKSSYSWDDTISDTKKYYNEFGLQTLYSYDGSEIFRFDEYGRILFDNDYSYEYNEQGQIIKYTSEKAFYYDKVPEYDRNGNVIKEIHYESDGSVANTTVFTYKFEDGRIVELHNISRYPSGKVLTEYYYKYEYDDAGRLLKERRSKYSDYSYATVIEYTYDENGMLEYLKYNDTNYHQRYNETYTYGYIWAPKWQEIKES